MKTIGLYAAAACVLLITLAAGFLVGWFLSKATTKDPKHRNDRIAPKKDGTKDIDVETTMKFMENIQARKIEENLR